MDQTSPLPEESTTIEEMSTDFETAVRDKTSKDFFKERNGETYAGAHVLADFWGAQQLEDIHYIEDALRKAIEACGATLLHIHLHHFGKGCGVSGVAVLAESHISVHTWPERGFAAFDIFMCGSCDPENALPVLQEYFRPERLESSLQKRGLVE